MTGLLTQILLVLFFQSYTVLSMEFGVLRLGAQPRTLATPKRGSMIEADIGKKLTRDWPPY